VVLADNEAAVLVGGGDALRAQGTGRTN
jgi:hypothetical protein